MSLFYKHQRQSSKEPNKYPQLDEAKERYGPRLQPQKQKQEDDVFKPKMQFKEKQEPGEKLRKSVVLADAQGQELGWCHNCCACTKLQYYKDYFKVTNEDVIRRIRKNLQFWSGGFFQPASQEYDFYGPFWIYTTIVFCLSAVPNIIKYQGESNFQYDFGKVGAAFGFMYIEGFLFPVLLTFLLKFLGGDHTHIQIICLYGYSMSAYIICLLLCSINVCILHYIFLIYGAVTKIAFISKNLFEGQEIATNKKFLIMGLIIVEAAFQLLVFKIGFIVCATSASEEHQMQHNYFSSRKFEI